MMSLHKHCMKLRLPQKLSNLSSSSGTVLIQ